MTIQHSASNLAKRFSAKLAVGAALLSAALVGCSDSKPAASAPSALAFTGGCVTVDVIATNSWQGGFNGAVRITNDNLSTPITSFSIKFTMGGAVSGSAWNGDIASASGTFTATNPGWLQYSPIAKGAKWDVGFNGSGSIGTPAITSVTINGTAITSGAACGGSTGGGTTDTTAPTVSLASSASSVTAAGSITLTATASDNVGVSKVEFYDGSTLLSTDTSSPFSASVSFTSANNGTKSYTAKAYDAAGNVATSSATSVTVNISTGGSTATASVTLAASPASITSGSSSTLTATPTVANTTVTNVQFLNAAGTVLSTDSTSPYTYSVSPTSTTTYTARVTTAANVSATATATVTVTTTQTATASVTLAASPASITSGSSSTLTATPTVANTTVTNVQFLNAAGTVLSTDSTSPYTYSVSPTSTTTYTARVTTAANVSATATATVTVTTSGGGGGGTTGSGANLANPFVGAKWYIDPVWSGKAKNSTNGTKIANNNTAVWMDRIGAIAPTDGSFGLRDHMDAALTQGANLIMIVVYDLPNRDCHALASNGELTQDAAGSARYKTEYIDPIAAIFSDSKYAALRIIAIIEPDSLPNLVTNLSDSDCAKANETDNGYVQNTRYTLNKLYPIKNVYSYMDIGHSGWLGWDDNLGKAVTLFTDVVKGTTAGVNSVAGFVSNTAGYTPLTEPFLDEYSKSSMPGSNGGTQVRQAKFYEWNPFFSEKSFVQEWRTKMIAAGFPSSIGMLIDTARNGWGGTRRPTAVSTSTDLETFVNNSRVDKRTHRGNWCNQSGGIGERPQVVDASGIDAYVWVKPPGESDGASSKELSYDPQDPAKGFDQMCSPTYTRDENGNTVTTGSLAEAPVAGRWFQGAIDVLVPNAYPAIP